MTQSQKKPPPQGQVPDTRGRISGTLSDHYYAVAASDHSLSSPHPTVLFDWQDWLPYLADSAATEDQKKELIETLWQIVLAFVDLGWEVKSDGDSLPVGMSDQTIDLAALLEDAMVYLETDHTKEEV